MSKRSKITFVIVLVLSVLVTTVLVTSNTEMKEGQYNNLPWLIDAQDSSQTKVIALAVGKSTLSEVVYSFHKLPELAVFEDPDGKHTVEAFFSKVKQDVLVANIVAEVDIEGKEVSTLARLEEQGKAMPSGQWRWGLSKTGITTVNQWRVWKLAYIPTIKYPEQQILKFFGQPDAKKTMADGVTLLEYSEKGLVITKDSEGRSIFYYSSRDDFKRLVKSLSVVMTPIK